MIRIVMLLQALRRDIAVLFFAMLRRDTPRAVKILFPLALLYLVSPIDLIPDTIPILGALDDAVILPAATAFLVRMLPPYVREESERRVVRYGTWMLVAASVVLILWLAILIWALSKVFS